MKLYFTFLFFLFTTSLLAQTDSLKGILPLKGSEVYYKQTFATPGLDKAEVFRRARRWWILNYKSSKDVLQLADDKTGELIGKGYQKVAAPAERGDMAIDFMIYSIMSLDAKDGGYDISVDQVKIINSLYAPPTPPIIYKRSPEKNLIRVFRGVDQAIKETMYQINQFIING